MTESAAGDRGRGRPNRPGRPQGKGSLRQRPGGDPGRKPRQGGSEWKPRKPREGGSEWKPRKPREGGSEWKPRKPRQGDRPQRGGEGRFDRRPRSAQAPSERSRQADPTRQVAFDLLAAVDGGAYANLALGPLISRARLRGRDAAFATELAYGTVRMRGRYDPIIGHLAERGLKRIQPTVLNALRLGLHQIVAMRVPDHAAVSETVALARERLGTGSAQLINAILRRVVDEGFDTIEAQVVATLTPDDALAQRWSQPPWIIRALRQAMTVTGRDPAEIEAVLAANNAHPTVSLVARPGLISVEELLGLAGDGATPGRWSALAVTMAGGDPGAIEAVRDGRAGVQDEGSQIIALALAAVQLNPGGEPDPERWLDLCAGPGGKAALLGALATQAGATLVAVEPQPHRAELVRKAVEGLASGVVEVRQGDGCDIGINEPAAYDRVLVDAPCTGLGALRRRPEARWRHQPSDLASLTPLQRRLLDSALAAVKPGGVVIYATCSPHIAETHLLVADVLAAHPGQVELVDPNSVGPLAKINATGRDGTVQLWTDQHGTDAMFCAVLRRLPLVTQLDQSNRHRVGCAEAVGGDGD